MKSIKLSGTSTTKGRNGYYKLGSADLFVVPGNAACELTEMVHVDFNSTRPSGEPGACLGLTKDDAVSLFAWLYANVIHDYPHAVFEGQNLVCSRCKQKGRPQLLEGGYTVSHHIGRVEDGKIQAAGWDGDSDGVSDSGDDSPYLICEHCGERHSLPEGVGIEWESAKDYDDVGDEETEEVA